MNFDYETRVTQLIVLPKGESLHAGGFLVTIDGNAKDGGEYVVVSEVDGTDSRILILREEWPALRAAINRMVKACR